MMCRSSGRTRRLRRGATVTVHQRVQFDILRVLYAVMLPYRMERQLQREERRLSGLSDAAFVMNKERSQGRNKENAGSHVQPVPAATPQPKMHTVQHKIAALVSAQPCRLGGSTCQVHHFIDALSAMPPHSGLQMHPGCDDTSA